MGDRDVAVAGPDPVHPLVELACQLPDFGLLGTLAVEVGRHGERPGEKEGGVDCRQFPVPDPPALLDVQEVMDGDPALDDDGNGGERHSDRRDAGGRAGFGLVAQQPVVGVGLVQVVEQRRELQAPDVFLARRPVEVGKRRRLQHQRHPPSKRT